MTTPKHPTPFELLSDLRQAADALARADVTARTRQRDGLSPIGRMHDDQQCHLKAQDYDREPRGSEAWCETHEREVRMCKRFGFEKCTGVPLFGPSDPTGEATTKESAGLRAMRILRNNLDVIGPCVEEIIDTLAEFVLVSEADARAHDDTERANAPATSEPVCECCARAGGKAPTHAPRTKTPTTLDGRLERPMLLCLFCQRFVLTTGLPPSLMVSEAHVQGEALMPRVNGDVIEVRTRAGVLVDRMPNPKRRGDEQVA